MDNIDIQKSAQDAAEKYANANGVQADPAIEEQKSRQALINAEELKRSQVGLSVPKAQTKSDILGQEKPIQPVQNFVDPNGATQTSTGLDTSAMTRAANVQKSGLEQESKGLQEETSKRIASKAAEAKFLGDSYNSRLTDLDAQKAYFDKKWNDHEQSLEQLKGQKITKPNLWANMSTGNKVMAGVGMFLSAMSPQSAEATRVMIQKAIDQDINIQQANIENKKQGEKEQIGLLKDNYNRYQDMDTAKLATQNQYMTMLGAQIDGQLENAKTDQMKGKLSQAKGLIDQTLAQNNLLLQAKLQKAAATKPMTGKTVRTVGQINTAIDQLQRLKSAPDSIASVEYREARKAAVGVTAPLLGTSTDAFDNMLGNRVTNSKQERNSMIDRQITSLEKMRELMKTSAPDYGAPQETSEL